MYTGSREVGSKSIDQRLSISHWPRRAIAGEAVDAAVGQLDVPLVAIPAGRSSAHQRPDVRHGPAHATHAPAGQPARGGIDANGSAALARRRARQWAGGSGGRPALAVPGSEVPEVPCGDSTRRSDRRPRPSSPLRPSPSPETPSSPPPVRRACRRARARRRGTRPSSAPQPRDERREIFGRRQRAREQRALQRCAPGVTSSFDFDDVDRRRRADATRDRAGSACAARARRASAPADGACARGPRASRAAAASSPPPRRDRRARATPTSDSHSRASTNDNGSRPSIGHSSSSRSTNRAALAGRHERRDRLRRTRPDAGARRSARAARARRRAAAGARSPSVCRPQRGKNGEQIRPPGWRPQAASSNAAGLAALVAWRPSVCRLVVSHRSGTSPSASVSVPAATIVTPGSRVREDPRRRRRGGERDAHVDASARARRCTSRAMSAGRANRLRRDRSRRRRTARSPCTSTRGEQARASGLERAGSGYGGDETAKQRVLRVRHVRRVPQVRTCVNFELPRARVPFAPARSCTVSPLSRRLCGLVPVQRRAASSCTDTPRALRPIGALADEQAHRVAAFVARARVAARSSSGSARDMHATAHRPRSSATTQILRRARSDRARGSPGAPCARSPPAGASSAVSAGPAHPQHAIEIDAGRRGRRRIESIERIDEPDDVPARGRRRQRREQHARPSRRSRADELRHLSPPPSAAEHRVERGETRRHRPDTGVEPESRQRAVQVFRAWSSDSSRKMAGDVMFRFIFALREEQYTLSSRGRSRGES